MTGKFERVFGDRKPVIGMVHLGALPGSPLCDREAGLAELVEAAPATGAEAVAAVLSVMPLDSFVDDSAARMEVVGSPDEVPPVQQEVQAAIGGAEGASRPMTSIERFAFCERAKQAYCVIQTGERRFYGCFAFRKGVMPPDAT
jgi:L-fucose mutarotase